MISISVAGLVTCTSSGKLYIQPFQNLFKIKLEKTIIINNYFLKETTLMEKYLRQTLV